MPPRRAGRAGAHVAARSLSFFQASTNDAAHEGMTNGFFNGSATCAGSSGHPRRGADVFRAECRSTASRCGHEGPAAIAVARNPFRDPGSHGRGEHACVPGRPRPAQRRARPVQGRDPFSPGGVHGQGASARDGHDVEDGGRRFAAQRRQGCGVLRPARAEPGGAGAPLPRMGAPAVPGARPGDRCAGAGRDDVGEAHGVDTRRVRNDLESESAGGRHGQAARSRRLAGTHGSDRLRRPRTAGRHPQRRGDGSAAEGIDRHARRRNGPAFPDAVRFRRRLPRRRQPARSRRVVQSARRIANRRGRAHARGHRAVGAHFGRLRSGHRPLRGGGGMARFV